MSCQKLDLWMPLYWGDYLRHTGHLGAVEHGAYLLLIGHYWSTGAPLPDDNLLLRRITRTTARQWRQIRGIVLAFFQRDGERWRHKRIDQELERWKQLQAQRAAAGRASAAARNRSETASSNQAEPSYGLQMEPSHHQKTAENSHSGSTTVATTQHLSKKESKVDRESLMPCAREKVQEIIAKSANGVYNHSLNGTNYDDPKVRKQRWEQKVIDELNHRLPPVNVRTIVAAYMQGDMKAKQIFNDVDVDMKRRAAR